ncbi:CHAT domain-containing protein [Flindersiella endophytica]
MSELDLQIVDQRLALGDLLFERYNDRHESAQADPADLHEAIRQVEQALPLVPPDSEIRQQARELLCMAYTARAHLTADISHVEAALGLLRELLADTPADAELRPLVLADLLGVSDLLPVPADGNERIADLDLRIGWLEELTGRPSADDDDPAQRAWLLGWLGLNLTERELRRHDDELESRALRVLADAEQVLPSDLELKGRVSLSLGVLLAFRYIRSDSSERSLRDRERAIARLERPPGPERDTEPHDPDDFLRNEADFMLGFLLYFRACPTPDDVRSWDGSQLLTPGARADFERAGQLLKAGLDRGDGPGEWRELAREMLEFADLIRSEKVTDRVLSFLSDSSFLDEAQQTPGMPDFAVPLARALALATRVQRGVVAETYATPQFRQECDQAIQALDEVAPLVQRESDDMRAALSHGRAIVHSVKGLRFGSPEDLDAAIAAETEALELMPPGHPSRVEALAQLAICVGAARDLGHLTIPLDRAVTALSEARDDPDVPAALGPTLELALGMLEIMRWREAPGSVDTRTALSHLNRALQQSEPGTDGHLSARHLLGVALIERSRMRGDNRDLEAGYHELKAVEGELTSRAAGLTAGWKNVLNDVRSVLAWAEIRRSSIGLAPGIPSEQSENAFVRLRATLAGLPSDDPRRPMLLSMLGITSITLGVRQEEPRRFEEAVAYLSAAVDAATPGTAVRAQLQAEAGRAMVMHGESKVGRKLMDQGIAFLTEAVAFDGFMPDERNRAISALGDALVQRYQRTGDPRDLDSGIGWLEQARAMRAGTLGAPTTAHQLRNLAMAYRLKAHRTQRPSRQAVDAARAALAEQARNVLLQTGAEHGISEVRTSLHDVSEFAFWCIDDGRPELAVELLEVGRGMVLHAATAATTVPALLREAGSPELAQEWETTAAESDSGQVYNDLRYRALARLVGSPADTRLQAPPQVGTIIDNLRAVGADALVYLMSGIDQLPGRALLVTAQGTTPTLRLPKLHVERHTQVARYAQALGARGSAGGAETGQWRQALEDVCDWAWQAAMSDLLELASTWELGRPPRLILVPCGQLGIVPWHAARHRVRRQPRYAVQDAVFSYAASARQMGDALMRRPRPFGEAPVVVTGSDTGLSGVRVEAEFLRSRIYPGCTFLDGAAEADVPDQILARLPGGTGPAATMLHIGCHAQGGSTPAHSRLTLDEQQQLRVDRILRQAEASGGAGGGQEGALVVLAACVSDLAEHDHDEALTLATAFLAGGAASVVGTRWYTDDVSTSLLMCMFHHYLLRHGRRPADALRSAQLWMLDPDREMLDDLPRRITAAPAYRDLTAIESWAAAIHHGL